MNLKEQIEKEITEKVMIKLENIERVELTILDNIAKLSGEATKITKIASGNAMEVERLFKKNNAVNKNLQKDMTTIYQKGLIQIRQAEDLLKPLGLKLPKEYIGRVDDLRKWEGEMNKYVSNKGNIFPS